MGIIPSELCSSTGITVDVSDTSIACYSGCLTSSPVYVVGASNDCHDGSIFETFLAVTGFFLVVIFMGSLVSYNPVRKWLQSWNDDSTDNSNTSVAPTAAVENSKIADTTGNETTDEVEMVGCDDATPEKPLSIIDRLGALYNHSVVIVGITLFKLLAAIVISLSLNNWWTLNGSTHVVESCANPLVGSCHSYCGTVFTVDVNITDDDYSVDDDAANGFPIIHTNSHFTNDPYCVAEFEGDCAYWLVFKLVPILLHLLGFVLQIVTYYHYQESNPQEKQYDTIMRYWYPYLLTNNCQPPNISNSDSNSSNSSSDGGDTTCPNDTGANSHYPHRNTLNNGVGGGEQRPLIVSLPFWRC